MSERLIHLFIKQFGIDIKTMTYVQLPNKQIKEMEEFDRMYDREWQKLIEWQEEVKGAFGLTEEPCRWKSCSRSKRKKGFSQAMGQRRKTAPGDGAKASKTKKRHARVQL